MTAGATSAHTANAANTEIKRALRLSPGGVSRASTRGGYFTVARMFRFDWLRRTAVSIAAVLLVFGLVVGCADEEQAGPDGVPLPSDFPAAQVPLIDGHVLSASGSRSEGWEVAVQGPANAGNQLEAATETLTEAGYVESHRSTEGGQSVVVLSATKEGSTYWVQIGASPQAAGGGSSVFYLVNVE